MCVCVCSFVCLLRSVFLYFTLNWTWLGVPKCHVFTLFVGLCVPNWLGKYYMDIHGCSQSYSYIYIHTYCDYILYTCSHTIYRYRYTMIYMITFVYTYDISIYNIYIYIFNYLYLHAYICVWYVCTGCWSLTVGCDDLRREAVATISRNWQVKCARALYAFVSCSGLLYPWRLGLGKEIFFFSFFSFMLFGPLSKHFCWGDCFGFVLGPVPTTILQFLVGFPWTNQLPLISQFLVC